MYRNRNLFLFHFFCFFLSLWFIFLFPQVIPWTPRLVIVFFRWFWFWFLRRISFHFDCLCELSYSLRNFVGFFGFWGVVGLRDSVVKLGFFVVFSCKRRNLGSLRLRSDSSFFPLCCAAGKKDFQNLELFTYLVNIPPINSLFFPVQMVFQGWILNCEILPGDGVFQEVLDC